MSLLHYRSWTGATRRPAWAIWPITRVALQGLFRRRLFWVLYSFALLMFLMFFFGSFLLDWVETQLPAAGINVGKFKAPPEQAAKMIRATIQVLNGSRETFATFFGFQATMVMIVLALAGSVLVGNDYTFRSLPFYLAKPIQPWHYQTGKVLATAIVVQLLTTLPALLLYAQHALDDFNYLVDPNYFGVRGPSSWRLLAGVLGYGLLLSVALGILLVAVATGVRRTMPLILVWTSLFFFLPILSNLLVDGLQYSASWRLLDLWNSLSLLGRGLLGYDLNEPGLRMPQPAWQLAGLSWLGVACLCLTYLHQKTRAVEIAR